MASHVKQALRCTAPSHANYGALLLLRTGNLGVGSFVHDDGCRWTKSEFRIFPRKQLCSKARKGWLGRSREVHLELVREKNLTWDRTKTSKSDIRRRVLHQIISPYRLQERKGRLRRTIVSLGSGVWGLLFMKRKTLPHTFSHHDNRGLRGARGVDGECSGPRGGGWQAIKLHGAGPCGWGVGPGNLAVPCSDRFGDGKSRWGRERHSGGLSHDGPRRWSHCLGAGYLKGRRSVRTSGPVFSRGPASLHPVSLALQPGRHGRGEPRGRYEP